MDENCVMGTEANRLCIFDHETRTSSITWRGGLSLDFWILFLVHRRRSGAVRSTYTQGTHLKMCAEMGKDGFHSRMEDWNLTILLRPANPIKRSVAVFVTGISVCGSAMVVGRKCQLSLGNFLMLCPYNKRPRNAWVMKFLRPCQPAPLNYFSWFFLSSWWSVLSCSPSIYAVDFKVIWRQDWYTPL